MDDRRTWGFINGVICLGPADFEIIGRTKNYVKRMDNLHVINTDLFRIIPIGIGGEANIL